MTDLEAYKDKFSESGQCILESAFAETQRRGQNFISIANLFYALMNEESELFKQAMDERSIDTQTVRAAVEKRLNNNPQFSGQGFRIAPETTEIFKLSMERARSHGRRTIEASDILQILIHHQHRGLDDILQNPESSPALKPQVYMTGERRVYANPLQSEPSRFLMHFSLSELIKKLNVPVASIGANVSTGGRGGWMSNDDSQITTHSKHEHLYFRLDAEDIKNFNEQVLMPSLQEAVKSALAQSDLEITDTTASTPAGFRITYKNDEMTGSVEVSGEIQKNHYELKSLIEEKNTRKAE